MDRSYYRDGTPLDILKRRAKELKSSEGIKLHEAQARIARDRGESDWSVLTQNCWAEPAPEPGSEPDSYFLERRGGIDVVSLDFGLLYDDLQKADFFEDLETVDGHQVWVNTEVNDWDEDSVRFHSTIRLGRPSHIGAQKVTQLDTDTYTDLLDAMLRYEMEGRLGPLITTFNSWGILNGSFHTQTEWGEFDAWLKLALRKRGLHLGPRYLLNTCVGSENPEVPDDWDWKRAFPFEVTDGRIAVCNGSDNYLEFRMRIFDREHWETIEQDLRRAFPNGPEKTHASETWLRTRLDMDSWEKGE